MPLQQRAYLLHSRPYQEHQLILSLLTERDGKVSAMTYRNSQKKLQQQGVLQPFSPLNILLNEQRAITSIKLLEADGKPLTLVGQHLYSGLYVNELVMRLLVEQHPCEQLFERYQQTLIALVQQQPLELSLRLFELSLLDELGLTIDFSPVFNDELTDLQYQAEEGFIDHHHSTYRAGVPCFSRTSLQAIAQQNFSNAATLLTLKRLMRQVFMPLLGNRPLKSRELFKKRELN